MTRRLPSMRVLASRGSAFPVALVVLALAKSALMRAFALGSVDLAATLLLEAAGILAIFALADVLGKRRPYLAELTIYAVLSTLMLAHVVYISEFSRPLDPRMLLVAGQAGDVYDSIAALLRPRFVLFVLDLPLVAAWAIVLRRRDRRQAPDAPRRPRLVPAAVLGLAATVLAVQTGSVLRLPEDSNPLAVLAARGLGPMQVASVSRIIATTARAGADPVVLSLGDGADVQARIESIRAAEDGARTVPFERGAYRGKNVIVIQVETLQTMAIGSRIDGKEITPNLNGLVAESWYFPNTFSQSGSGVTADAEFVANSGLYGPIVGAAAVEYADREIPGLPRLLRAEGYDAVTLHQNEASFWNRAQLYPALGFRRYYDHEFFGDRDKMWHASDRVLFEDGLGVLADLSLNGKPFYANFVTMTSHSPYKYPKRSKRTLQLPEDIASLTVAKWAAAQNYTDTALGEFLQGLRKQGLYDDSIILIYGDHSGMQTSDLPEEEDALVRELIGRSFTAADRQRVPLVIHLPGQTEARSSDTVLGTVDIMPTIADLTGLDLTAVPHFGRSAFVDSGAFVPMRAFVQPGTFVNDRVMFTPGVEFDDAVVLDVRDGSESDATDVERSDLERQSLLNELSEQWIRSLPRRPDAPEQMDKGFEVRETPPAQRR